ncbi:hypothetical protein TeGR_g12645 [Tetraparma gracilis]|uniref:Uncharacterized protein n=1 Tax=Tetraparma gracilis TaxID=2962635 RepID=A0ABQ6MD89_9STRA|nr:hypothetical protein TeGR_g12645 [Tetraparma gracilis]
MSHRDWVLRCVYQELENGDVIISITSVAEHAAATNRNNAVRATGTRLLRFSQVTPTVTRFVATASFDLGGSIPRFVSDTLTTPAAARAPLSALGYFLQIKETAELDAAGQDARALGQLLVHEMEPVRTKKRPEELELKLYTFVYRTTVLRELADVLPWFPKTLFQILRNLPSAPRTTQAKLADFTERDAVITGQAVAMLMLSSSTPDAVVDEIKETAELDAGGQDARALAQLLVHEMEPVRAHKRPQHLELKLYTAEQAAALAEEKEKYKAGETMFAELSEKYKAGEKVFGELQAKADLAQAKVDLAQAEASSAQAKADAAEKQLEQVKQAAKKIVAEKGDLEKNLEKSEKLQKALVLKVKEAEAAGTGSAEAEAKLEAATKEAAELRQVKQELEEKVQAGNKLKAALMTQFKDAKTRVVQLEKELGR